VNLDGRTVSGLIYVFVEPITDIKRVEFYIDGILRQSEGYSPFDLAGTASRDFLANPFDTSNLADGAHDFTARITKTNDSVEEINAQVNVANSVNLAPVITAITAQSVQEGSLLQVAVNATDSDGPAPLVLSQTNTLPGNPEILTDYGNGVGEVNWTPAVGTAGGPYQVTITARDGDGASSSITFSVTVTSLSGSIYQQLVSTSSNRANPVSLDGRTVSGLIYVFVEPITDIKRVEFYIDGILRQSEGYSPFDLAGTASRDFLANPFDTSNLADGAHDFTARITKTNDSVEEINAQVNVDNSVNLAPVITAITAQSVQEGSLLQVAVNATDSDGPAPLVLSQTNTLPGNPEILTDYGNGVGEINWTPAVGTAGGPYQVTITARDGDGASSSITFSVTVTSLSGSIYQQLVSTSSNRANPVNLDGRTVSGLIYVFVEPITDIKRVEFYIDGILRQSEGYSPFDLAGTASRDFLANPFDTSNLADGAHDFTARITKTNDSVEVISSAVTILN
jgi:hypothetical protein